MASPHFLMEGYIMQIELTLEKEVCLEPGASYRVLKAEGKKVTMEKIETAGEPNPFSGLCSDKESTMQKIVENAMQNRERGPRKKRKMSEILAGYQGRAFKDAQDVDDFIRKERESWEK
jgi:hypothetical protein